MAEKIIPLYAGALNFFTCRLSNSESLLIALDACAYFCPVGNIITNERRNQDRGALVKVRDLFKAGEIGLGLAGNQAFETMRSSPKKREKAERFWGSRLPILPQEIDILGYRGSTQIESYENNRKIFEDEHARKGFESVSSKVDWGMATNAKFFGYPVLTIDYKRIRNIRSTKNEVKQYILRPSEFLEIYLKEQNR